MGNKQLFAKIGVFVLLGLNVGAYYAFWPSREDAPRSEASVPREETGTAQLLPAAPERKSLPTPKEVAAVVPKAVVPQSIAAPKPEPPPDEAVNKLLAHIKKETEGVTEITHPMPGGIAIPLPTPLDEKKSDFPAIPQFPELSSPKPLPILKADPLDDLSSGNVGVTPALTPRLPPSPWTWQTKPSGKQTLLTAQLDRVASFEILCDRVERKGTNLIAIGKVTFTGNKLGGDASCPVLWGECGQLTLPLSEAILSFDGDVRIQQRAELGVLRGEHITWEPVAPPMPTNQRVGNPPALGPPN